MAKTASDAIREFLEEVNHVDKLHPESDQELLFNRRYRIAYYHRPEGTVPCPICQEKNPNSTPVYIKVKRMKSHCKLQHIKAKIQCEKDNCLAHFRSQAEKESHNLYCHTKPYGWWIL